LGVIFEVSCIQYEPLTDRSKDDAERVAILEVCKALRKRGLYGFIFQYALKHRKSGHIHVAVVADENDYRVICGCCKAAQKPIDIKGGGLRFKTCDCKDCVACDPAIRVDLEQLTRE
jgi:hypothetical protein